MIRSVPARFALPPGSARGGCKRTALSLALIVCLTGSGRSMTAQEQPQSALLNEQQRSPVTTIIPGLEPALSASVSPRLFDVQRRPLHSEGPLGIARSAQRSSSRDTLKNGAIIGAVAGAAGLGALGALICHLYQEEDGPSCLPDTLRVAAIGAAIGTAAGVAVDAALTRNAGVAVRVSVRF
jgi:hypothetical protein